MTTNLNRSDRKYISLIPKDFAKGIVYADHGTVGYFSRYRFHLSLPAGQGLVKSLDGGRIVVEFPISTSFDVYFDADLGNPLNWSANGDNSRFPCQNIGLKFLFTTVTYQRIQCWMEKGDPTQDNWTRIIIDNFDQLNAGETDIMFDFPMVKNPTQHGDDKFVNLNVYATDVAAGFPGVKVAERTAKYVVRLRNTDIGLYTAITGQAFPTRDDS